MFLYYCIIPRSTAQTPFTTVDSININNITAAITVHGDMWLNPITGSMGCYMNDSNKSLSGFGGFWISGYNASSSQLHVSAQIDRSIGIDYWPGPLDASDTLTYATSQSWAKIWKVSYADIQYYQSLATHNTSNTPEAILTWPGKGNANAQGNGVMPLTITNNMAPFIDLNGNGIYEPLLGEYPDIKGDEALWWVFSDNGPTHSTTHGKPLNVEIDVMAYAYKRNTLIDNVVYYEYTVKNHSSNTYDSCRIGLWDDVDLGWYYNDYIGFDSTWRMGISYQAENDNGTSGGHPVNFYFYKPMSAITMVASPGDAGSSYVPAGSFVYLRNDNSVMGLPTTDTQYSNYMRARLRNGQHYTDDFVGPGIPSVAYGSGGDCNYVFPGDPTDTMQWSECVCANVPSTRNYILTSNDFTLNAGANQKIVFAVISTKDTTNYFCPHASFSDIKIVADTAWANYYHPPGPDGVKNIAADNAINIYPNPAHNVLYIETNSNMHDEASVTIHNSLAQVMNVVITRTGQKSTVNLEGLSPGLYNVLYRKGTVTKTVQFVKE